MSIVKRYASARSILNGWDSARLSAVLGGAAGTDVGQLLLTLGLTDVASIAVSKATGHQIYTVTGVNVEAVLTTSQNRWPLETQNKLPPLEPSQTFLVHMARYGKWFSGGSEALTRSKIDTCLTEAMERGAELLGINQSSLKFFGEVTFRMHDPVSRLTLNGDAEYSLAFGENGESEAKNVSFIVEAKSASQGFDNQGRRQLLAYMAIVHCARKKAKKAQPGVFGLLTDVTHWEFFRIDNDGIASRSSIFYEDDNYCAPLRHLAYVTTAAQALSPATTPYASREQLRASSLSSLEDLPGFRVSFSADPLPAELPGNSSEEMRTRDALETEWTE
ncbi:hypothetical protein HDU88_003416 [Geranomyces variabilis]|nr:hypothetical protein HDU88_003416 [Geranomyces variabilis]